MLRDYQLQSVESGWSSMVDGKNPLIVLPTGAGKSWVIADLCRHTIVSGGRVIVLCHRKELIEQNAEKIQIMLSKDLPLCRVGIFSAGLNSRDLEDSVIVGGIQSVYDKAPRFARRHIVLVDECHLIPNKQMGMYHQFLKELAMFNPKLRVCGLSATPYRLDDGDILEGSIFNEVCIDVPIERLMDQGYLCRLTNKSTTSHVEGRDMDIARGEFTSHSMESAFNNILDASVKELVERSAGRKSILVFTASVAHGESVAEKIVHITGERCEFICGDTPALFRAQFLEDFKAGSLRWLVNVNVLTTGFDATRVDCVAVIRSTLSAALFAQMLGRGLRIDSNKQDCLVLDFGQNLIRHGPINDPEYGRRKKRKNELGSEPPLKSCPKCNEKQATAVRLCWNCGYEFPAPEPEIEETPDTQSQIVSVPEWKTVVAIDYRKHINKSKGSTTFRVDYQCDGGDLDHVSEWVCIEHEGFARSNAERWWRNRSNIPTPLTVDEAISLANCGALRTPSEILVKEEGRWLKVINAKFDSEKPSELDLVEMVEDEEIPF